MFRGRLGLAAALATFLVAATPASAHRITRTVAPFRSIGGIQLGWSPAQVSAYAGPPQKVSHLHHRISADTYEHGLVLVNFDGLRRNRVVSVSGGGRHFRMGGVRYHASLASLRRRFRGTDHFSCIPHIACSIFHGKPYARGSRETSFLLKGNRVIGFSVTYDARGV